MIEFTCERCGDIFEDYPSNDRKYCSRRCSDKSNTYSDDEILEIVESQFNTHGEINQSTWSGECSLRTVQSRFGGIGKSLKLSSIDGKEGLTECPECGALCKHYGSHISNTGCEMLQMTSMQKDICAGLVMGDGTIQYSSSGNPCLRVRMTNQDYLSYLDSIFGLISTGVRKGRTAREVYRNAQHETKYIENYNDIYDWATRNHPYLQKYKTWYNGSKKSFDMVSLNENVLKHWYVCDGSLDTHSGKTATIYTTNEIDNESKIKSMFDQTPLDPSINYAEGNFCEYMSIDFYGDSCTRFLEYIGDPVPGFEYKWL